MYQGTNVTRAASLRRRQRSREQSICAVVLAAARAVQRQARLARAEEAHEEEQRHALDREDERVGDEVAGPPGVSGEAAARRVVVLVDARAGAARVVEVDEDVPRLGQL